MHTAFTVIQWLAIAWTLLVDVPAVVSQAIPAPGTHPELPAVRVRVEHENCGVLGCTTSAGAASGTIVAVRPVRVLTNDHVVRDRHTGRVGRPAVQILGDWHAATVVADSRPPVDLALIEILPAVDADVPWARLADEPPAIGEVVYHRSFVSGRDFVQQASVVTSRRWPNLVTGARTRLGQSGGSIVNARGELVGVHWGGIGGTAYGMDTPVVRQFLEFAGVELGGSGFIRARPPDDRSDDERHEVPEPRDAGPPGAEDDSQDVDWSDLKIVVLRSNPDLSDRRSRLAGAARDTLSAPIRRRLSEASGGRVDVELVHEQIEPARYAAVAEAVGRDPGSFLVVVLVRRQDLGLIRGTVVRIVTRKIEGLVESKVGVECISERLHPRDFAAVEAALSVEDGSRGSGSDDEPPWWWGLVAGLLGLLKRHLQSRRIEVEE